MAKTARAKTAIQIAAEAARDSYTKAKALDEKASNATTQAALAKAKTMRSEAEAKENRERFQIIGGGRVAKALSVIETLKQVSNRRSYNYTADDITKAMGAIRDKLTSIEAAFTAALAAPVAAEKKKKEAPKAFKFE